MFFAPLAFLRRGDPSTRSRLRDLDSITFPDSQDRSFKIEYYDSPPSEYSFIQIFPAPKDAGNNEHSFWLPPPHYHLLQDEHFKVTSGAGIWHLYNKEQVRVSEGQSICVKARHWHWFEPDPDIDQPFAVLYRYDQAYLEMERSFFRNQFAYLDDCRKYGIKPSIFQTMVCSMHNYMALALPESRFVPEWLHFLASLVMTLGMGVFGQFLLGYRASYDEYYEMKKNR